MSQYTSFPTPAPGGGAGDEWAVGMPAYWLKRVDEEQGLTPAEVARFYFVKPGRAIANVGYDQRLIVRVGGTEKAARAVVDFAWRYFVSMGERLKTTRSIGIVQERMVRAWELAGRPGAV